MIGSTRAVTVYAWSAPVDLRKGFDGLSALVRDQLRRDLLSGDLFLFTSRDRKRAKVLLWDGTGLCVFAKRIESGRFASLWRGEEQTALPMTVNELQLFLEGSQLIGRVTLSPPAFVQKPLASLIHR